MSRFRRTGHPLFVPALLLLLLSATLNAASPDSVLWRDPGAVSKLDLTHGPGGRKMMPVPPFRFVEEDLSGSSTKLTVVDGKGRRWNVKFGPEAKPEAFSYKLAWAAGYYVQPMYLVREGRIAGLPALKRPASTLESDGRFRDGRFQWRDPGYRFSKENNWSWDYNPFVGTRELNGLKLILLLTSNWDNKDARDVEEGINTAIFEQRQRGSVRYIYTFTDWGQTLGHWGNFFVRSEWNCGDFRAQNREWIRGVRPDGGIEWGYRGRHSADFTRGITADDVAWIMRRLGQLSDAQLHAGLRAAGATPEQTVCFASALRERLNDLRRIAATATSSGTSRYGSRR